MRKFGLIAFAVLAFAMLAFSATTSVLTGVVSAVKSLCQSLMELLPIVAMLMIVVAGVIYAGGQMMGAETRARANVWATAALVGAIIAILIVVIAPPVLNLMYPTGNIGQSVCS
ncbi:MAG: hypothetical protein NTV88_04995 [Candidatus Micrarchaeota archaeon]|nr:hypothetical protein [Candidatus Micrarchaeota archaeon]